MPAVCFLSIFLQFKGIRSKPDGSTPQIANSELHLPVAGVKVFDQVWLGDDGVNGLLQYMSSNCPAPQGAPNIDIKYRQLGVYLLVSASLNTARVCPTIGNIPTINRTRCGTCQDFMRPLCSPRANAVSPMHGCPAWVSSLGTGCVGIQLIIDFSGLISLINFIWLLHLQAKQDQPCVFFYFDLFCIGLGSRDFNPTSMVSS